MSVLLRCPASVPALFSRAVEHDLQTEHRVTLRRSSISSGVPLAATSVWAAVVLIEVPLIKAATVLVGRALPG